MSYLLKRPDMKTQCIWKILSSRRMLSEHMEVVELCYEKNPKRVTVPKPVLLRKTVCAGCVLTIAATTRFSPSYTTSGWQMVVAAGSALLFGAIAYEDFVLHRELAKIESLIKAIEQYDVTVKRTLVYINETVFCKQQLSSFEDNGSEQEMLYASTRSCTKAIYDMYDYVKVLEQKTNIGEKYAEYYDPLESFENCGIFKQTPPNFSMAKVLYNLFLYTQSHCLQRLSLAIDSDAKLGEVKAETNHLIRCLTGHTDELKQQMLQTGVMQRNDMGSMANVKDASWKKLSMVKHHSVELAGKLTANARQMFQLDENIQCLVSTRHERMQLLETAGKLNTLRSCLLTRVDECQHLLIMVNNLLHVKETAKQHPEGLESEDAEKGAFEESCDEMPLTPDEQQDEFFFVNTGTDGEEDANESACGRYSTAEEELVAKRLMTKRFKPVMEQLRERLIPVDETFRKRERVALERKGIQLQDDEESHDGLTIASKPNTSDSDDESDVAELEAIFLGNRTQHKYNADRDFLAGKQQISLLVALPKGVEMEEDILE